MTTNNIIGMLTNSNNKLDAVANHVCNGAPLSPVALVSDPAIEPNPEAPDELCAKAKEYQSQADAFYAWAEAH